MSYTNLLKDIWRFIYAPESDVVEVINKFFHPDYTQCINGEILNRAEYIQHVLAQKKNMIIDTMEYKHILEKGEEVFALYYPRGRNRNNNPIEGEVIAYFCFKGQQVFKIHGQVRLLKGDLADVDMKND